MKKSSKNKKDVEKAKAERLVRLKQHQWKKGQSGNPAGRKKKIPKLESELIELLGGMNDDGSDSGVRKVLKNVFDEATKKSNPNAIRAAAMLIERAYGREAIAINSKTDITSGGEKISSGIDLAKLNDETIKNIMAAMREKPATHDDEDEEENN